MYVMLIHENDASELRVEKRFGVCDPHSFVNAAYVVTQGA